MRYSKFGKFRAVISYFFHCTNGNAMFALLPLRKKKRKRKKKEVDLY